MKQATFYKLCSTIILITLFSNVVSFAWLSTRWKSTNENTVTFTSGSVNPPCLTLWVYDEEAEDEDNPWKEYYSDADDDEPESEKVIQTVVLSDGNLTQVDGRLQFGMVTSLVEETDENDVYFRFDIDGEDYTEKHYDTLTIDYHYVGRYVDVYRESTTNTPVSDAELYTSLTTNDVIDESYVVTTEELDMTTQADDVLALFAGDGSTAEALSESDSTDETTEMQNGTFYVYVKLSLNRDNLRKSLRLMNDLMPCYLVFNIYLGVEPTVSAG